MHKITMENLTWPFNPDTHTTITLAFKKEAIEGPDAGDILETGRQLIEMLLMKNRAYGSSFSKPINIFSKIGKIEALNVRLDDKLCRIRESKDFSEDTEMDLLGYLFLKRVAQMQIARDQRLRMGPDGQGCEGAQGPPPNHKPTKSHEAYLADEQRKNEAHQEFYSDPVKFDNKTPVHGHGARDFIPCKADPTPGPDYPVMVPRPSVPSGLFSEAIYVPAPTHHSQSPPPSSGPSQDPSKEVSGPVQGPSC